MAPRRKNDSNKSEDVLEQPDGHHELTAQETVLGTEPRGISNYMAGLGNWASGKQVEQTYPADIDIESDDTHHISGQLTPGASSSHSPPRLPPPGTSTPTPTRDHIPTFSPGPAMRPEDIQQLLKYKEASSKKRRRGSSGDCTVRSSYVTASECPTPPTVPSNNGESDGGRVSTPFLTPSQHTPSHYSLGTTEGTVDIKPPGSPYPFSSHNPHNGDYAKAVLDKVNNVFPTQQNKSDSE